MKNGNKADIVKKLAAVSGAACAIGAAGVYFGAVDILHPDPEMVAMIHQRLARKKKGAQTSNRNGRGEQIRIACVGDSITYGCFVAGQPWNSYPRQLAKMLGDGYLVANYGYTNRTAIRTADYPYTAERLYSQSLEYQPDIVLLLLGANDTKAHNWDAAAYKRDMNSLIDSYLAADPHTEVILMLPLPHFEFMGKVMWDIRVDVLEGEVIPICREIAEERGLRLIDTHSPFIGRPELFTDGVHPTAKGAKLLAQTVFDALKMHLE